MTAKFSIHENLKDFPHIEKIALGLSLYHNRGVYLDFLGHYGQFENNSQAMMSNLHKMHIALCKTDFELKSWHRHNGHHRTSDNFVIYTQHFLEDEYFQVLGVVSPEAHKQIDQLLPLFIQNAECFHHLTRKELIKIPCLDSDHYVLEELEQYNII